MKIETTFNFGGFYESLHSDVIDLIIEQEKEHYIDELTEEKSKFNRDLLKKNNLEFWELYDYEKTYINYCKQLLDSLEDCVVEASEGIKSIKFIQLDSPKFYNYSTDTIQAVLEIDEGSKISVFKDVNLLSHIKSQAKEDSTTRSGYIAFKKYNELIKLDSEYIFGYLLDYYYKENQQYIFEEMHDSIFETLEIREEYKTIFDKLKC